MSPNRSHMEFRIKFWENYKYPKGEKIDDDSNLDTTLFTDSNLGD